MAPHPCHDLVRAQELDLAAYEDLYKDLHQNPELAFQEHETSAKAAAFLRKLSSDLDIRTGIGGTGLVAILKNGAGKTVLLRADMDALPLREKTGLDYASTKDGVDSEGNKVPVMHACGHDMHVTCLLGAADLLLARRASWSGTVVFLLQPAEEGMGGAQAMIDDGLYVRHGCPVPDMVLAQHVGPLRAGAVSLRKGPLMAASNGFRVTVYGRGGHASMPQLTVDPIVVVSHVVVRLQTIVSREVPPSEQAVVSVCLVRAGSAENVISDSAELLVNIRSLSVEWRGRILESVRRIVEAECRASNCPKEPAIEPTQSTPMTINDGTAADLVMDTFSSFFGRNYVPDLPPLTGSEDVSVLATFVGAPYCFWFFGGIEAATWDEYYAKDKLKDLPYNHSPNFAPSIHPTIRTGVNALTVATMTYLASAE